MRCKPIIILLCPRCSRCHPWNTPKSNSWDGCPACRPKTLGHSCLHRDSIYFREAKEGPKVWTWERDEQSKSGCPPGRTCRQVFHYWGPETQPDFPRSLKKSSSDKKVRQCKQRPKARSEREFSLSPCGCPNHAPSFWDGYPSMSRLSCRRCLPQHALMHSSEKHELNNKNHRQTKAIWGPSRWGESRAQSCFAPTILRWGRWRGREGDKT